MKESIQKKSYTYEEYLKFPEGERIELIDGEIYYMSPAPSRVHQRLVTEISREIGNYVKSNNRECEVYVAPFDVRFVEEGDTEENSRNVVQPDISVICDKTKLDDRGCIGAPDFIIEIVAPSNASIDYVKKLYLYEKFRVREYWIVNPLTRNVIVYRLNEEKQYWEPEKYSFDDTIKVGIFKGLEIKIIENL